MSVARSRAALIATLALLAAPVPAAMGQTSAGVVPDLPTGAHLPRAAIASASRLGYQGGPVLHTNRTHVIFWEPAGSGLRFDGGYESLIETFLSQVAADQRKPTNVYGLTGQYADSAGPAANISTFGGAVVDTDPLPLSDCAEPLPGGPGWTVCLQTSDLVAEIQHVVALRHLPTSLGDVYFLLTPNGFGSCSSTGPDDCALGGEANSGYCGVHGVSPDGTMLYGLIPYNGVPGHCESENPRPNASTADPTISSLSHEHNEIITDPFSDAWSDPVGRENGDKCAASFGRKLGDTASGAFNQAIAGGHYYLQQEWSNDDNSCQSRDESYRTSFSAPTHGRVGRPAFFRAHAHDPDGKVVAYRWFFGDGRSTRSRHASHLFRLPGVYRVVLRTTDSAGNWAFSAGTIRVGKRR